MQAKIVMVQEFPIEGLLRIRIDTYREPGEVGYEEHYVQVTVFPDPAIPLMGYPGETELIESMWEGEPPVLSPVDYEDYEVWVASLPKVWQNNPCLNQFIQVPIGTPEAKIAAVVQEHTKRVKAAGLNVKARAIQEGLRSHLKALGIDSKIGVKARSIRGMDAVVEGHRFLKVEAVEK